MVLNIDAFNWITMLSLMTLLEVTAEETGCHSKSLTYRRQARFSRLISGKTICHKMVKFLCMMDIHFLR